VKGRLVKLLAGISLLLCVATGAMWVEGYFASSVLHYDGATWGWDLRAGMVAASAAIRIGDDPRPRGFVWLHDSYSPERRYYWSHLSGIMGFNMNVERLADPRMTFYCVTVPRLVSADCFSNYAGGLPF